MDKNRKLHRDKSVAVNEGKDQIAEYEEEAEVLREHIEKGVAKLAQSYSEQKLVLATIEGGEKETAAPEPADLLLGIESMQGTYTGFFSGAESTNLPPDVKEKQKEFEVAFTKGEPCH